MSSTDASARQRLTIGEALKDFGWFSMLFAATVSGPSVLSLAQAVLVDHKLVHALQWIVDGYDRIAGVLGAMVEPLMQPAIDWLNAQINWNLALQPHWQSLFALAMVFVGSFVRSIWRDDNTELALTVGVFGSIGVFFGALVAGLMPLSNDWLTQGTMAAAPIIVGASILWLLHWLYSLIRSGMYLPLDWFEPTFRLSAVAFGLGAGLTMMPILARGAGVAALGLCLTLVGFLFLRSYSRDLDRQSLRLGLTVLGGFFVAGLIFTADGLLKAIGQA